MWRSSRLIGLALVVVSAGMAVGQTMAPLDGMAVRLEAVTGRVSAIRGRNAGEPILARSGAALLSAEAFLAERGGVMGITDPARELMLSRRLTDPIGWTTSEYRQMHLGCWCLAGW